MKPISEVTGNLFPMTVGSYPARSSTKAIEFQAKYNVDFPSTGEIVVAQKKRMEPPYLEAFNGIEPRGDQFAVTGEIAAKSDEELAKLPIIEEITEAKSKVDELVAAGKYDGFKGLKFTMPGPGTLVRGLVGDFRDTQYSALMHQLAEGLVRLAVVATKVGACVIQIDEPMYTRSPKNRDNTVQSLRVLLDEIGGQISSDSNKFVSLHACGLHSVESVRALLNLSFDVLDAEFAWFPDNFEVIDNDELVSWGKSLGVGVVTHKREYVETDREIYLIANRIVQKYQGDIVLLKPDCGLRTIPPAVAEEKLKKIANIQTLLRELYRS